MTITAIGRALFVLLFSPSICLAGIMTVGPFAGDNTEGWESGSFTPVFALTVDDILGGTADARALGLERRRGAQDAVWR